MTPKPKTLNDWLYMEMESQEESLKRAIERQIKMPERRRTAYIRKCKRIIKSIKQLLIVQGLNPDKREPTVYERLGRIYNNNG